MKLTILFPILVFLSSCLLNFPPQSATATEVLVFVSGFRAAEEGAIHALELDTETGTMRLLHRTADVENPFFLAMSPDRETLYSIHAPGSFGGKSVEQVAAYQIEGESGQLRLLNRQSSRGSASCYLDVDATGKCIVVANYSTGSVASLPVQADGSLAEPAAFRQHAGSSVDPARQTSPHAHCIIISPDNRFAFAADLGLDKILAYRLDAGMGTIEPHRQPFVRTPPGAGPRHLAFHPNGRHLYAINELHNSVTLFDYEPESGILIEQQTVSTLPDDFDGTSYCADVKLTPNGRFLYGTNRGHDSIAVFRVEEDGRLERQGIQPSLGKGPQNLAILPDGQMLLCANMPGNNVVAFKIDSESGRLEAAGDGFTVPGASCIVVVPRRP